VCHAFKVGQYSNRKAIAGCACSVEELGAKFENGGTNCGFVGLN